MDGPRDCHTEWNKSDREREISYIAYMRDLQRNDTNELVLQNRNRLTDLENELTVTKGQRVGGINWGFEINRYTLLCIK